jgi:hypothetical protein
MNTWEVRMMDAIKRGRSGWVALTALGMTACSGWLGDGPSYDCQQEAVTIDPEWECSPEVFAQIEQDRAVLYGSRGSDAPASATSAIISHDSCESGVQTTRAALGLASDLQLRAARADLLSRKCEARTEYRSSGSCPYQYDSAANLAPSASSGVVADVAAPAAAGGATEYSTTNTQVEGVDEADFVKNDARFVYTLAGQRPRADATADPAYADAYASTGNTPGELVILDVWPAEQAHEVSRIPLDGHPKKLYLDGDRLLVYASLPVQNQQAQAYGSFDYYYYYNDYGGDCTYGYDCVPRGDGLATLVTVYDVSDRAAPRALRQLTLSGSYINSRRVGDVVYTLVQDVLQPLPGTYAAPADAPTGPEQAVAAFAELSAANRARIDAASPAELLPNVVLRSTAAAAGAAAIAGDAVAQPLDCGRVFEAPGGAGRGFLSVVSLSLADDGVVPERSTIVSEPGFTYASADALYVAVPQQNSYDPQTGDYQERSTIHKFDLDGLTTGYAATGLVEGRVLNQFSMDEYADHLRVASTSGYAGSDDTHSALSVLAQQGSALLTVGKIDDIAPREDIRSARFVQDRGYVVTFEKTDPLYVFDLSEPAAPRIAGELKIPGFSTYMHPIDREHLLSVGYDADDQGDFSWFRGIQLQVFDVADMSKPTLLHRTLIGTRGSSSEALENHLAFNYFAPKRWLALPITICEGGAGSDFGELTFSGLYLYDVSLDSGFSLLGGVSHPPPQAVDAYGDTSCYNWWSDASSQVKRSIIMDDVVLSITGTELKLNHAADLAHDVAVLPLSR